MLDTTIAGVFRRAVTVNGDANKKSGARFRFALSTLLPALALVAAQSAHGALLGVTTGAPMITTTGFDISNTFVPGTGGTLTINGNQGSSAAQVTNSIQLTAAEVAANSKHMIFGCSTLGVSTSTCATPNSPSSSYVLTANFDASGAFTGGSLTVLGYIDVDTSISNGYGQDNFNGTPSGTLLVANLNAVGFRLNTGGSVTNGSNTSYYDFLTLDFKGTVTGGDLKNSIYDPNNVVSGLMNSVQIFSGSAAPYTVPFANVASVTNPFTTNFACGNGDNLNRPCAGTLDTMVPLPATAWLLGSGLAGLLGMATRSRKTRKC
jgi:hypothetical protein